MLRALVERALPRRFEPSKLASADRAESAVTASNGRKRRHTLEIAPQVPWPARPSKHSPSAMLCGAFADGHAHSEQHRNIPSIATDCTMVLQILHSACKRSCHC
jgi:hypothetical protein